jgi:DNA-binding transcriptional MerR regulator
MTIAEVAEKYGLTTDTLRYYERVGLLPPVTRDKGGMRDYGEIDCQWVDFIVCMRGAGVAVAALLEYIALFKKGDGTREARKKILQEQRRLLAKRMDDMKTALDKLDFKVAYYDTAIRSAEDQLTQKEK